MTTEATKISEYQTAYGATSPGDEAVDEERTEKRFVFPLRPFRLLEHFAPSICEQLPCCIREIHSLAHLTLVLGISIALGMLVKCVVDYRQGNYRQPTDGNLDKWVVATLIGSFVFSASCLLQLMIELAQFNVDLQARAKDLRKGAKGMMESFNELSKELDSLLKDSMDTQAALAERSLESQRRDCTRFFQSIEAKLQRQVEQQALFANFRTFVELWLNVFAECSINPDTKPYEVVTPSEVHAARSSAEIAKLVESSLRKREIKFLSDRVEEDKKLISKHRTSWKHMVVMQQKACRLMGLAKAPDPERGEMLKTDWGGEVQDAVSADAKGQTRWLIFGWGLGMGAERPDSADEDGFPVKISAACFQCTLLSDGHLRLICTLLFGAFLVPFTLMGPSEPQMCVATALVSCMVCVAVVLHQYQTINQVQRLQRQIILLQDRQNSLNEGRTKMVNFYNNVQQLADFWLYRTLPRLEFMKQCAYELEDVDDAELLGMLTEMVAHCGSLENALLPASMWRDEHAVSLSCKKRLAATYNDLANAGGMKHWSKKIPEAIEALSQRKQEVVLQIEDNSKCSAGDTM